MMTFREITAADVPALFHVPTRTRENTLTVEEEWLAASGCARAWLTTDLDTTLRAYGLYRKRGWTDWKIERGLRWMELSLAAAG